MEIKFRHKGGFDKTSTFLGKAVRFFNNIDLDKYGREGVVALESTTPRDTGLTASSWSYKIERTKGHVGIVYYNSNVVNHIPIAIVLQYGHATRNGGWVEGQDYINPALRPIFDELAHKAWMEVSG